MRGYWRHPTPVGVAKITRVDGRWRIVLGVEDLGSFDTPEAALVALLSGRTERHSRCPDTSVLAFPPFLPLWYFVPAAWEA